MKSDCNSNAEDLSRGSYTHMSICCDVFPASLEFSEYYLLKYFVPELPFTDMFHNIFPQYA